MSLLPVLAAAPSPTRASSSSIGPMEVDTCDACAASASAFHDALEHRRAKLHARYGDGGGSLSQNPPRYLRFGDFPDAPAAAREAVQKACGPRGRWLRFSIKSVGIGDGEGGGLAFLALSGPGLDAEHIPGIQRPADEKDTKLPDGKPLEWKAPRGDKDKKRRQRYIEDLERIIFDHPDDVETKAFLVNQLWLPNIFIYNLKTFKVLQQQWKEGLKFLLEKKGRKISCCFILNPFSEYIVISDSKELVTFGVLFLFIKHKWKRFSLFVAWQSQHSAVSVLLLLSA